MIFSTRKLLIRDVLFKFEIREDIDLEYGRRFLENKSSKCAENTNMRTNNTEIRIRKEFFLIDKRARNPGDKLATRASRRSQIRLFGKLNLSKSPARTPPSVPSLHEIAT